MNRLKALAEWVDPCECVADIGCDHGYLAEILIREHKVRRVIACDISPNSVRKAEKLAREKKLPIETRCGDGLTVLCPGEVTQAVIAGMGGLEILRILSERDKRDGIETFVVSPQSELTTFRGGLASIGLEIEKERIVYDRGHDYFIMKLVHGNREMTAEEQEFGLLIHTPTAEFNAYMDRRIKLIERKLSRFGTATPLKDELRRLRTVRFRGKEE